MSELVSEELSALQAAADQARARYDHAAAVALYTEALNLGPLSHALEFDLLASRAESLGLLGKLQAEQADLERMLRLAEAAGDVARQARALTQQVLHSFWVGGPRQELPRAERALALARQAGDAALEAESQIGLSTILAEQGNVNAAGAAAAEALRLYRARGDLAGQSDSLWHLANYSLKTGQAAEAEARGQQALALARQSGDRTAEMTPLTILANMSRDLARARSYAEQALALALAVGNRKMQTRLQSNLCYFHASLGLYGKGRQYGELAVQNARDSGALPELCVCLDNLGLCYFDEPFRASALFGESRALARELGNRLLAGVTSLNLGRLALADGRLAEARAELQAARAALADGDDSQSRANDAAALACLGLVSLAEGDAAAADRQTARAVADLAKAGNPSDEYRPQVVLWCRWQVLVARGAPAAKIGPLLEAARQFVLDGIASLSDPGLRRNYLNKIAYNRELMLAWDGYQARPKTTAAIKATARKAGAKKAAAKNATKKTAAKKTAAKPATNGTAETAAARRPTANLQEQFKRLLDLGARMNEQ